MQKWRKGGEQATKEPKNQRTKGTPAPCEMLMKNWRQCQISCNGGRFLLCESNDWACCTAVRVIQPKTIHQRRVACIFVLPEVTGRLETASIVPIFFH
jgi:hypothetical protein